jgi:intermembrane space import and assembly protein 40
MWLSYGNNGMGTNGDTAAIDRLEESIHHIQQSEVPTIEAIVAEKRARAAARAAEEVRRAEAEAANIAASDAASEAADSLLAIGDEETGSAAGMDADFLLAAGNKQTGSAASVDAEEQAQGGNIEDLEAEADQQGAFNPETGEINWDCPCLGGMAHGPCGPEFREAFSCFVYSKEEPKGMECIDKFKYVFECWWSLDPKDEDLPAEAEGLGHGS